MLDTREQPWLHRHRTVLVVAALGLLLLGAAVAGYIFWQRTAANTGDDTDTASQTAATTVVAEVAKLYDLPTGEDPQVASISDTNLLTSQDFYSKAQNGDYVLIYPKAQLALLYRKQDNRLINVDHVQLKATK